MIDNRPPPLHPTHTHKTRRGDREFSWERIQYTDSKCAKSLQSCPTLCDPMNYSPPGFCVHGILQERILEWVAISVSRGSSQHRDQTQVSCVAGSLYQLS